MCLRMHIWVIEYISIAFKNYVIVNMSTYVEVGVATYESCEDFAGVTVPRR